MNRDRSVLIVALSTLVGLLLTLQTLHAQAIQNTVDPAGPTNQIGNPLSAVIVHEHKSDDASFFTLDWEERAAFSRPPSVDVYMYNKSGTRFVVNVDRRDKSDWIDQSIYLCQQCKDRSVTINEIGEIAVARDQTLFELVWRGADPTEISIFGKIDQNLNWIPSGVTETKVPKSNRSILEPDSDAQPQYDLINNLTTITVQEHDHWGYPNFWIFWNESALGRQAAVDVYVFDASNTRQLISTNKWDNSSWLDYGKWLCVDCGIRSLTVPQLGTFRVARGETLFELIWRSVDAHGQRQDVSTFGTISPELRWTRIVPADLSPSTELYAFEPVAFINNLTAINIQAHADPYFSIIWEDSPQVSSAPVDVYVFDALNNRQLLKPNHLDQSGWLNGEQWLCTDCAARLLPIPALGTFQIGDGETLFELVWRGEETTLQEPNVSTFGIVTPDLIWTRVAPTDLVPSVGIFALAQRQILKLDPWPEGTQALQSYRLILLLICASVFTVMAAVGFGWWLGNRSNVAL